MSTTSPNSRNIIYHIIYIYIYIHILLQARKLDHRALGHDSIDLFSGLLAWNRMTPGCWSHNGHLQEWLPTSICLRLMSTWHDTQSHKCFAGDICLSSFNLTDIMCKFYPYLKKVCESFTELNKGFMSVTHAKVHSGWCEANVSSFFSGYYIYCKYCV